MATSREDADEKTMYMLKKTFANADKAKLGFVQTNEMESILNSIGATFEIDTLGEAIKGVTDDGKLDFENFVCICMNFMEEEDEQTVSDELRGAFRLYDKDGTGFIATKIIEGFIKEIEPSLSDDELAEGMAEFDEEGTGKISLKTFMKLLL